MTAQGRIALTGTRLRAGVWEGLLSATGDAAPRLEFVHGSEILDGLTVEPAAGAEGRWHVRARLPADRLGDGVETFVIRDRDTGDTLSSFSVAAGSSLEEDLRAEVDLLRAELDMLKRAFRRHCIETG